jgi:hypothetical protein
VTDRFTEHVVDGHRLAGARHVAALADRVTTVEHMAATNDPGILERISKLESEDPLVVARDQRTEQRVVELERLTGMLVKSVGVLASSPQARATGQVLPTVPPDRDDRPATYGPVPSPYGRPSPAWAVDVCGRVLSASSPNRLADDSHYAVEDASVEYVHGEPTLRVQVSGVLYRFHAPDVISDGK